MGRAAIRMRAPPLPRLQGEVGGDDRELVDLRIAECDYFLQRLRRGLEAFGPGSIADRARPKRVFSRPERAPRSRPRRGVPRADAGPRPRFPDSSWSEEALNNLGTYYILKNDDAEAAQAFDRAVSRSSPRASAPSARRGSRDGGPTRTPNTERRSACSRRPRPRSRGRTTGRCSCTGRRGRTQNSAAGGDAQSRLRLIVTDYGNWYYGRLAGRHLSRSAQTTLVADAVPAARQSPPTARRSGQCRRHPAASRQRALRRRVERAALRAAKQRLVAGHRGDDCVGVLPKGRAAPGDHVDAPRLSRST